MVNEGSKHIDSGICPNSKFPAKLRISAFCKQLREQGSGPVMRLFPMSVTVASFKFPSSNGMQPDNLLLRKRTSVADKWPMLRGIGPVNLLFAKVRKMAGSEPKFGGNF